MATHRPPERQARKEFFGCEHWKNRTGRVHRTGKLHHMDRLHRTGK